MRFAFITDELPRSGLAGHLAFNHAVIEWLRGGGHEVVVLLVRPRLRFPVERYDVAPVEGLGLTVWGRHVVAAAPRDAARILGKYFVGRLPGWLGVVLRRGGGAGRYGSVDTVLGAFVTPAEQKWVGVRVGRLRPDAVLVDTVFRAAVLREPQLAGLNSVILAHDVFFMRHRAMAAAGYRVHPSVFSRQLEAELLSLARCIAASQPEEADLIRQMCPQRMVCTSPLPALPNPRPAGVERLADRLVFVGSDALPNLDGLRWFLAEIWPRLRIWRNTLTLDVVGDCGRSIAEWPEGVHRLGRVKDLAAVLHRASLAIAPLRVGSGLKIKLLDYARHGLMTVATPASVQGFAQDQAAPFVVAADAVSFAVAVADRLRLLKPLADERRALDYVTRYYGVESSFGGLATALRLQSSVVSHNSLTTDE
jgi:succinoglycan biosynthesis protein ExoO